MGLESFYLFRLDEEYVVRATPACGAANFRRAPSSHVNNFWCSIQHRAHRLMGR